LSDILLDLSTNPFARKLVRQLRLPIPMPEPLRREDGPWSETPLAGRTVIVGGGKDGRLAKLLEGVIKEAGGILTADADEGASVDALVLDATGVTQPSALRQLYDFLRPRLARLGRNGRVVLVGPDPSAARSPEAAAAAAGLTGFTKSLAKELGRKAATCQTLYVDPKAEDAKHLVWPLRYLLSARSAFVSGQILHAGAAVQAPDAFPLARSLAGKTALVTGAARGIGAEIARRLAAEGARVLGVDRPQEEAPLTELMTELGGVALPFDLIDPATPKALAAKVEAEFGHLDVLVNNAGITRDKTLARMSPEWWDDSIAINLTAALRLTEHFVHGDGEMFKLMNAGGRIIFMSSVGGIAGNAGQTNYAAGKAGLIGYVHALAPQVARRGLTVNAIAPGFIETRMTQAMPIAVREVARRFNSLNQAGLPADVADAVVFLAAPGAFAVTGEVIRVCGQNLIGA
jgi:3-oxoacyl-[acyl-carrier protein] reductase